MTKHHASIVFGTCIALFAACGAEAAVTISTNATQNISCVSGVCSPTANKATLNVTDLETLLGSGNTTIKTTGGGGVEAKDIVVNVGISWTSSSALALDAFRSVAIDKPVAANGTGGVAVTTNDGGSGGTFSFGAKGNLSFLDLASALTINETSYMLVNSLPSLAAAIGANPAGAFALANGYDASHDGTYTDSPVTTTLTGSVQGLGNTISNLSINHQAGANSIGMFTSVAATGAIENLRLTKIAYTNTNHKTSSIGGLAAQNDGLLFGDKVSGSIHSTKLSAGGLVAFNGSGAVITQSSANVKVVAYNGEAGGLAADNSGTITLSNAGGTVGGEEAGGLVGGNAGTISKSFATGAVNGGTGGGFVGGNGTGGAIENSYSTGEITSSANDGGFVGVDTSSNAPITNSYSIGVVFAAIDGGFACQVDPSNVANDYWDVTTSGTTYGECENLNISGITGLTTQQLQSGLPAGFDPSIWAQDKNINNGFPYLIDNPPR